MADVYLDEGPARTVDVYIDSGYGRGSESVYHQFGLPDGRHTVRLVVRGEPYEGSKGTDVILSDLIVFR